MCEYSRVFLRIHFCQVNPIPLEIITVKLYFVFHPEEDQSGTRDTDRQAKYIQEAIGPVFPEVAQQSVEEIFEHAGEL